MLLMPAVQHIHAAGAYPLDNADTSLIGINTIYTTKNNETLLQLAREYDVGYNEIIAANKYIDPWVPGKGRSLKIPTLWLLPDSLSTGMVINLAEMRLYYFLSINDRKYVMTHPIGIGREGADTPTGDYVITAKIKDPVWKVPDIIRENNPDIPLFVAPGPHNPLGKYWLQLSIDGYGIHGTNFPYGIGRRVSHGCIRLYPEDIEILFKYVTAGTSVKIINDPVKIGLNNESIYLEVHNAGIKESELLKIAIDKLNGKNLLDHVNPTSLISEINKATGLPVNISR